MNCTIAVFQKKRLLDSFTFNITETKTDSNSLYSELINNECPYHKGSPYPDHQSLMINYENGVLCNFSIIQAQPANRRTIHILGSEARLYGVVDDNYFTIFHRTGPNDEAPEIVKVNPDSLGHNGGDSVLVDDFIDLINGKENLWRPGLREGIESAIMCIVADESAGLGHSINLAEIRSHVFDKSGISKLSECKHSKMSDDV